MVCSNQQELFKEIQELLVDILKIQANHGHIIIYNSPPNFRYVHQSRDRNFIFVEISMFSGRSQDQIDSLFLGLNNTLIKHTHVKGDDILINIIETERNFWAKNGKNLSKLNLGY